MKRKLSVMVIVALLLISLITLCYATEVQPRSSDAVTTSLEDDIEMISEDTDGDSEYEMTEILYNDLFEFADEDYEMSQWIDGNAYIIASENVKITGSINGTLFILAKGTVEITENAAIADALYVCADKVKVDGSVYDIYSISNEFELTENGYVSRDIKAGASNIKLIGTVYRDVYLDGDNIEVKDENAELFIGGNFTYSSQSEIAGIEEIVQYGEINFAKQEDEEAVLVVQDEIMGYVTSALSSIVYVLVIYGIFQLIAPKFTERTGKDLKEKGIVDFAIGLLSWVIMSVAVIASILILLTSIAYPITIIMWLAMIIMIYISSAVVSISILEIVKQKVEKIRENKGLQIATLIGIAVCIWVVQQLPYIGGVIAFIIITTGLGLIVRNIKSNIEKKTTEETETIAQTETTDNATTGEE